MLNSVLDLLLLYSAVRNVRCLVGYLQASNL